MGAGKSFKVFHFPSPEYSEGNTQTVNWDQEARVDRVTVEGLSRTKNDVVINTFQDIFSAKTFEGIVEKCAFVTKKLNRLDCFSNIKVFIDVNHKNASKHGYEVFYKLEEYGRVRAQSDLALGNNEGAFVAKGNLLNINGNGEKVETRFSYSTGKTSDINLTFSKPLTGHLFAVSNASLFHHTSQALTSGYKLKESGILLDLEVHPHSKMIHNVQYEGVMRDLSCITKNIPYQVREYSGVTLKSCIRHIMSLDLRDSAVFPRTGMLIGTTSELAGLGGDIGFLKNESFFQVNMPLTQKVCCQFTLQTGILNCIDDNKKVSICDKLFLGGPLSVRGFATRGIGPHTDDCALGVQSYWASGFHLYSYVPFTSEKNRVNNFCRNHVFLNVGNCGPFNLSTNLSQSADELWKNLRLTYGMGLCFHFGPSRVELNYCVPLYYQKGDSVYKGLQISLGGNFL